MTDYDEFTARLDRLQRAALALPVEPLNRAMAARIRATGITPDNSAGELAILAAAIDEAARLLRAGGMSDEDAREAAEYLESELDPLDGYDLTRAM